MNYPGSKAALFFISLFAAALLASCALKPAPLPPPPPGHRPEPELITKLSDAARKADRAGRGSIEFFQDFDLASLHTTRDIWIYTPPGYADSGLSYPVLYMQDGQNLFYDELSFVGEWHVDEVMDGLYALTGFPGAIVVGVANGGMRRMAEYSPYPDDFNNREYLADEYLDFIVNDLKPWVDARYRSLADPEHCYIGGSSLGGIVSIYAGLRYPDVFGGILAMSPSLWLDDGRIVEDVRRAGTALAGQRIYLDMGTAESGNGVELTEHLADIYRDIPAAGFRMVIDPGAIHNEIAWSRRLPAALAWLFGISLESIK